MNDRIAKDKYFMNIARVCSTRSNDPTTKFGCVAVSKDGAILSTGYNGPPRNVDDSKIPLTRPEKYTYMEHAERNCIYNAARVGTPLDGCIFYVTGIPCVKCMRGMYQVGASEVVMLDVSYTSMTSDCNEFIDFISKYMKVRILKYEN